MITVPYPWQQCDWQNLSKSFNAGRFPHAILLHGQRGIGKHHFAQALSHFLFCSSPRSGMACGQCRQCVLNRAENHPDKKLIRPDNPGGPIKIDQIRALTPFITETSQQAGRKVIIDPVERLNSNAANALLKSLEEPSNDTYLILVSHLLSGVLATIRSRCHIVSMKTPSRVSAGDWLHVFANLR